MDDPQKPFACNEPDCGMSFTNEDHLHVHTKKHDMVLQLGEQKNSFADQTPTPSRFFKTCDEVGLFQDIQNVNPFEEGFKRAMEAKTGLLSLDGTGTIISLSAASDDVLHTPQMMFPSLNEAADSTLFSSSNNQSNITISRSSSDEAGIIKEYETTTISKLTNEVATISRVIEKSDVPDKITANDDMSIVNETVSYTNNVIKIHSNVEIKKDWCVPFTHSYSDPDSKNEHQVVNKYDTNKLQVPDKLPLLSQKSLDYVVDSLAITADSAVSQNINEKDVPSIALDQVLKRNCNNKSSNLGTGKTSNTESTTSSKDGDYEFLIKLPTGDVIKFKGVKEIEEVANPQIKHDTKDKLKKLLTKKVSNTEHNSPNKPQTFIQNPVVLPNVLPITGTLFPVNLVNPVSTPILFTNIPQKVPIPMNAVPKSNAVGEKCFSMPAKRKIGKLEKKCDTSSQLNKSVSSSGSVRNVKEKQTLAKTDFEERRTAASKRYREKLKNTMAAQTQERHKLLTINQRLEAENAALKKMLVDHAKTCPSGKDIVKNVDNALHNPHLILQNPG